MHDKHWAEDAPLRVEREERIAREQMEKERLEKLSKARTGAEFNDLYLEVFGEEFPIINLKNPSEKIEMLIDAIETNKKIEGLELPDGYNI